LSNEQECELSADGNRTGRTDVARISVPHHLDEAIEDQALPGRESQSDHYKTKRNCLNIAFQNEIVRFSSQNQLLGDQIWPNQTHKIHVI
jgi:hypothetical protein